MTLTQNFNPDIVNGFLDIPFPTIIATLCSDVPLQNEPPESPESDLTCQLIPLSLMICFFKSRTAEKQLNLHSSNRFPQILTWPPNPYLEIQIKFLTSIPNSCIPDPILKVQTLFLKPRWNSRNHAQHLKPDPLLDPDQGLEIQIQPQHPQPTIVIQTKSTPNHWNPDPSLEIQTKVLNHGQTLEILILFETKYLKSRLRSWFPAPILELHIQILTSRSNS